MKIGIITYHRAINYGAYLQSCALCNRLISEGYDAEIIDFRTKKEEFRYSLEKWKLRKKLSNYREYIYYKTLFAAFQRGHKDSVFKLSDVRLVSDSIEEFERFVAGKYDVIISGSDEVWKTGGRGFPNAYWQFGDTGARKFSYAAASARSDFEKLPDESRQLLSKAINQFEYIGVRDQFTFSSLKNYVVDQNKMHYNCDPSFIYDFKIEKTEIKFLVQHSSGSKRFDPCKKTIVYMCEDDKLAESARKGLGGKYNLLAVFARHKGYINLPDLSPLAWMTLIAKADFVIASYFHAICFSIKNGIPFLAIGTPSKVGKLSELLNNEFDNYLLKEFDLLTPQKITQLVEDRMKHMDNSVFLSKMEESFQGFLKALSAVKSETCETNQDNERLEQQMFSKTEGSGNGVQDNQSMEVKLRNVAEKNSIDCCGCGLCSNICPYDAIHMQLDSEGFYRPVVDSEKCVDCGLCVKNCIHDSNWAGMRTSCNTPRAYAYKHSNEDVRSKSRSGGFFTTVSDYVLDKNGAVYGSAFSNETQVKHIRAVTYADRDRMRGSKYVMSPSFDLFKHIKDDLHAGKYVLYSGCPCQVAALKKYVEKQDCSKLILVDLLCHGVPSIRVWNDYVQHCQKSKHGKITEFQFRNKEKFGWAAHHESFVIGGVEFTSQAYTDLFSSHQILSQACSKCQFKSTDRISDFTLGDFWGIDDALPGFNDDKGVSLVLVNTKKASELFKDIVANEESCIEVPLIKCMQNSMKFPYPLPKDRVQFWDEYNRVGIGQIIKERAHKAKIKKIKRFIRRCLPKL